jgi:hypothetical protein
MKFCGREESIMENLYEVPEVSEIGEARNLILGTTKEFPLYEDSPGQPRRDEPMSDDE